MALDPLIANMGVPLVTSETMARIAALKQRDRALDQDQQILQFNQQRLTQADQRFDHNYSKD